MKFGAASFCAATLLVAACTEHLTTPGACPTFCPGGQSVFRDTILTPIPNGDSSFTGFVESASLSSILVSNGGQYGQNRAVIRFLARPDSVLISDTNYTFSVDSVSITIGIQDRDTTAANYFLQIYRLPRTLDSTAGFSGVDNLMTPANLLGELSEAVSVRSGNVSLTLSGAQLAEVGFAPSDSNVLEIGLRVRADGPAGTRIGALASGDFAPLFTTYVTANGVVDSLSQTSVSRIADLNFTVTPPSPPPPASLLAVGGIPVSRSFIRFALPPYLRDSATIIRATLQLQADAPVIGIPADTALLTASTVLVDFGAKSPVVTGASGTAILLPGVSSASLEITPLVQLWQGATPVPSIVRLALAQEGATFIFPLFRSTRSASGAPTLRITYRPPFAFEGY